MTAALIECAEQLATVLARENAALVALDLAGATAMLEAKLRAAAAFSASQTSATPLPPAERRHAEQVAARLVQLAEENRRLLERAISVQGRLIGCIAKAVPRSAAPRYRANGALTGDRTRPIALSARA